MYIPELERSGRVASADGLPDKRCVASIFCLGKGDRGVKIILEWRLKIALTGIRNYSECYVIEGNVATHTDHMLESAK